MVGILDYVYSNVELYDGTDRFLWYMKVYDTRTSPWCYVNGKKTSCYRVKSTRFDGYRVTEESKNS